MFLRSLFLKAEAISGYFVLFIFCSSKEIDAGDSRKPISQIFGCELNETKKKTPSLRNFGRFFTFQTTAKTPRRPHTADS